MDPMVKHHHYFPECEESYNQWMMANENLLDRTDLKNAMLYLLSLPCQ